jgi:hypothetical protein
MIPRRAAATARRLARGFPVVFVTGPRQSGKSTLVRAAFARKPYVSLETPDDRAFATEDPRGFLARYPRGAVIDEVQQVPGLLSYIQIDVDTRRAMGRFVLTGSQNLLLTARVSQSLAGRAAWLQLLPLQLAELVTAGLVVRSLDELMYAGSYPALYDRKIKPADWYASYVATYVERDVRQLAAIQDLALFQRFLRLCAARTGQLLNQSNIATDLGVAVGTIRHWLSVLEASFVIVLLQPHHSNFGKRLVRTPKLYFCDTGLAAYLVGIRSTNELSTHSMRPALFETWALSELRKRALNKGEDPRLFFWRDNIGTEIDAIVDGADGGLQPIEVKSGSTIAADAFRNINLFRKYAGERVRHPTLVYGGDDQYVRAGTRVVPWRQIDRATGAQS